MTDGTFFFRSRSLLRPEKKDTIVCLAGARSLLRPEKKDTVVCLAGARSLLLPEKKSSSRLSGWCAVLAIWKKGSSSHAKRGQVPPAHAKQVYLFLCLSVSLSVRKG